MRELYRKYELGDMQALYMQEKDAGNMELFLLPKGVDFKEAEKEKKYPDSLVQIKIAGDMYPGGYAGGRTLRQGGTVQELRFKNQSVDTSDRKTVICTELADTRGHMIKHYLSWHENQKSLFSWCVFENHGTKAADLEMLSSFSLGGISPFVGSEEWGKIKVHRIRSVWSMEGRLETRLLEDYQLETSWAGHAVRCERFGQTGSMPVNGFFPYLAVEDTKSDIFWGVQLMHNASWQMELYRSSDDLEISGGLADFDFGHWKKTVEPGASFVTPTAILSVCKGDGAGVDTISQRLTAALQDDVNAGPESEQELPIIFNEYCTTWGCPSHENICNIVDAIRNRGFSYFVIDCGWYKQEGIPWDVAMGDYHVSKELFPKGLLKTTDYIRKAGMKPGIWFEIDNVGEKAECYNDTEHLLKRDGAVLTTSMRRFWDMRQEWVQEYLSTKVIDTLKIYGFSYMKMDYNDTIGLGCDGAESLGEGLRQNMESSLKFIQKVKAQVPGIILENCSSGGHKLEPLMMSECSMASFSDAHECEEIPIIAANLHRVILPRQSQIWAVIRKDDSLKRIAYSVANTFLGRMCISGDVTELSDEQWDLIDRGIAFYKKAAAVIKDGFSIRFGPQIISYRHPTGWQCLFRVGENNEAMAVIHTFYGEHDMPIVVNLPESSDYQIREIYSDTKADIIMSDGKLICKITEDMRAVAVLLKNNRS